MMGASYPTKKELKASIGPMHKVSKAILGTILESKSTVTGYGREYRVQWDSNPDEKSMDGLAGTALARQSSFTYLQGDRVELAYISDYSSGLWYIMRRV